MLKRPLIDILGVFETPEGWNDIIGREMHSFFYSYVYYSTVLWYQTNIIYYAGISNSNTRIMSCYSSSWGGRNAHIKSCFSNLVIVLI